MDDATTLRMMEKENLKSFKELTKVYDTNLLKKVIEKYGEIDMCDYSTILMIYKEEKKQIVQRQSGINNLKITQIAQKIL